jgi:hypothetical protein
MILEYFYSISYELKEEDGTAASNYNSNRILHTLTVMEIMIRLALESV